MKGYKVGCTLYPSLRAAMWLRGSALYPSLLQQSLLATILMADSAPHAIQLFVVQEMLLARKLPFINWIGSKLPVKGDERTV